MPDEDSSAPPSDAAPGNGKGRPPRPKAGEPGFELEALREGVEERLRRHASPPPPPPVEDDLPPPRDEGEVDTRTVAERLGQEVERHAGARPVPEGWPAEALAFPLRGDRKGLGVAVALWVALDFVGRWNLFVGVVLKILAYVFFLRWQLGVANSSAAGRDVRSPFAKVADIDFDGLKQLLRLMGLGVLLVLPGILLWWLGPTAAGVLLTLFGLLWAAVAALGQVVGEPSLVLPWKAFPWMGARPLALLAGTVGWVAAVGVERLEAAQPDIGVFAGLVLFLTLRVAFVYLWLLSARALGVVGRAWSPYGGDDA